VELAPGRELSGECPRRPRVSILVFVELAPGPSFAVGAIMAYPGVSILVFVELAPGRSRFAGLLDQRSLFQSLFLWNSRPDYHHPSLGARANGFQSLFLWNSRPDASGHGSGSHRRYVSILVFVELAPGLTLTSSTETFMTCFNPCFCGTRARTRPARSRFERRPGVFQSLFLWNSRPDPAPTTCGGGGLSFNPCFCGTRARTL